MSTASRRLPDLHDDRDDDVRDVCDVRDVRDERRSRSPAWWWAVARWVSLGAATLVASGANYASNLVLGRRLEVDQFADAALVVSGLLLLSAVALGLQLTIARAIATGGGARAARRLERRAVIVGAGAGAAVAVLSPVIASRFNMASPTPLIVLGAGVPIFFSMAMRRGVLQASHRFGQIALSQVAEPLADSPSR